jgi:hypothetical protein
MIDAKLIAAKCSPLLGAASRMFDSFKGKQTQICDRGTFASDLKQSPSQARRGLAFCVRLRLVLCATNGVSHASTRERSAALNETSTSGRLRRDDSEPNAGRRDPTSARLTVMNFSVSCPYQTGAANRRSQTNAWTRYSRSSANSQAAPTDRRPHQGSRPDRERNC